jgi:predicted DNA-binding transcriptional regulator AlpA
MQEDPLLRRPEAAAYLGTTTGSLAQLAYQGNGPKYYKPSPRRVYYRKSDLDAWINSNAYVSTAESV